MGTPHTHKHKDSNEMKYEKHITKYLNLWYVHLFKPTLYIFSSICKLCNGDNLSVQANKNNF